MNNFEKPKNAVAEALIEIEIMKGKLAVQGNMDFEWETLKKLSQNLKDGEIAPEQALKKLDEIESSRIER